MDTAAIYMTIFVIVSTVAVMIFGPMASKRQEKRDRIAKILRYPFKVLLQAHYLRTYYLFQKETLFRYVCEHEQAGFSSVEDRKTLEVDILYKQLFDLLRQYINTENTSMIQSMLDHTTMNFPFFNPKGVASGYKSKEVFCEISGVSMQSLNEAIALKKCLFVRAVQADAEGSMQYYIPRLYLLKVFPSLAA